MSSVTVWIDPLDATQEYTEGGAKPDLLRFVTVMLCIAVSGKPIAGVIHQPFAEEGGGGGGSDGGGGSNEGATYWGWVGHGMSRSLYDAANTKHPKTEGSLRVTASRSHAGDVFKVADEAFHGWRKVERVVAAGSGFKALSVAERANDLYLHTTAIKKWDICAGNAVLNTLHGRMTTIKGDEIDYGFDGDPKNTDGIVAAYTTTNHQEYLKRLQSVH